MGIHKLPDGEAGVNSSEINWIAEPIPRLERVDLLTLTDHELWVYCSQLQDEAAWLRAALHEALALLHRLTRQAGRYRRRIEDLLKQLRAGRRERKAAV
jgi:hypothetical protein